MKSGSTLLAFFFSLFLAFFSTLFFPEYRIVAFTPFIAIRFNRFSLITMLWWAVLIGLISDLTSVHYRFGITALCFVFVTFILYPFRRQFYEEKPIPFLVLSYLISSFTTMLLAFISIYKGTIHFSNLFQFIKEIFISSLFDVLLGFIFVFIPVKLYTSISERGIRKLLRGKEEV